VVLAFEEDGFLFDFGDDALDGLIRWRVGVVAAAAAAAAAVVFVDDVVVVVVVVLVLVVLVLVVVVAVVLVVVDVLVLAVVEVVVVDVVVVDVVFYNGAVVGDIVPLHLLPLPLLLLLLLGNDDDDDDDRVMLRIVLDDRGRDDGLDDNHVPEGHIPRLDTLESIHLVDMIFGE